MKIYNYDENGIYGYSSDANIDPLETLTQKKDIYLVPFNATSLEPPHLEQGQIAKFKSNAWTIEVSHKGKTVYSIEDKAEKTVEDTGPLEEGFTLKKPNRFDAWVNGNWVHDLAKELEFAKKVRLSDVNSATEQRIISGFISNALGAEHRYQSNRDDQLNLIGAAQSGVSTPFKCADPNGVWSYRLHTSAQLQKLLEDGSLVKLKYLRDASELKSRILKAVSITDLSAIT